MQFYDKVKITVESGKGGDGCVSGRRETGVPHGGPAGGNGGKGGSIILQADRNLTTLLAFKYNKNFKANNGEAGKSKQQYGANAENLILKVPIGTMVIDIHSGHILHYFALDKEKFVVAKGGDGGVGNMEFKSPTLQYPNFATLGEPGHKFEIGLELQLSGDVALIGNPSVGKSSLINSICNTKAKVADYPFTTLVPHLGSVKLNDFSYNIVDVPGLIPGASVGKGLGNEFLRHILKAKVFCLMGDLFAYDKGIDDALAIFNELVLYMEMPENWLKGDEIESDISVSIQLRDGKIVFVIQNGDEIIAEKLLIFVFNKFDLVQDEEIVAEIERVLIERLLKYEFGSLNFPEEITAEIIKANSFIVSAATHYGIDHFTKFLADELEHFPLKNYQPKVHKKHGEIIQEEMLVLIKDITEEQKDELVEDGYIPEAEALYMRVRQVDNPEICRLVFTTQRGNHQAEMHFWKKIEDEGFLEILQAEGFAKGDVMRVVSYYEDWEDRFVQW